MWTPDRSLLPRLPWSTQVCPGEDRAQTRHSCLGCGSPGGNRCVGKTVDTGVRDLALGGDFASAREGQPWRGPFLAPRGAGASMWGERECNVFSTLCASINSGALLQWHSRFPPQTFLLADFLPPSPSGCLLTANSTPPTSFALLSPRSSSQPPCTLLDTRPNPGHAWPCHRPSV